MKPTLILFSEIVEANGKTIRENNMEKGHNIPLQSLVETAEGLRLYVVMHGRDCDGTPLYWLSFQKDWSEHQYGPVSEDSLRIIK